MNNMKKLLLLLLVLPVWAGCNKSLLPKTDEFTHTGCATDAGTRAGTSQSDVSLLTLKYEDGNLRVTRTNATMNCAIKLNGIACDVSVRGNTILYRVYEKDGPTANCMCRVAEMSSVVTGLKEGKEYTFNYSCSSSGIESFTFVFKKGLHLIRDEETYPFCSIWGPTSLWRLVR